MDRWLVAEIERDTDRVVPSDEYFCQSLIRNTLTSWTLASTASSANDNGIVTRGSNSNP
jgi:hypothetical protein